LTTRIVLAFLN